MDDLRIHPRILSGYGLVEAAFDKVADSLGSFDRAGLRQSRVVRVTSDPAEPLSFLDHRTVPATRLVIVDGGTWTPVLSNHRNGSDFTDHQEVAARSLGVRTIRVVDSEARWWRSGQRRERLDHEARIYELRAPDAALIRSIACADDGGRWVFEAHGDPMPAEAAFDYSAPRKRDRFRRSDLHHLLRSVGAEPLTRAALMAGTRFALVEERIVDSGWRRRVEAAACTLDEGDDPAFGYFQRGMTWVPHMRTHAASVIADFERAIEINPSFEPRVRDLLADARRISQSRGGSPGDRRTS